MNKEILWPGWDTVRMIGRGSFGSVYEIQREVFGDVEKAAIKVLSIPQNEGDIQALYDDGYDDESVAKTFQCHLKSIVAEYTLMRKLNGCSNIVNCENVRYIKHDDGIGWDIFIKMELLTPLAKSLPAQIPEETVIRVAEDICKALIVCKKYGIIHRDIKPQNIFLSPHGDYKLGDFGIAKTVEQTMGGTKIGTYNYMAPEVYNNQPYGAAVDIYSLGLVLYWLLNERRMPFLPLPPEKLDADVERRSRERRFSGELLPPPLHGSKKLKSIVLKACAFDPKDRYASAREMLNDLQCDPDPVPDPPKPPDLDVHKEITFKYKDHPAGKYYAIRVDTREVRIHVPINVKDGQIIHLPGEGRYDSKTDKSGDLYVTIHILPETNIPVLKLILAVAAHIKSRPFPVKKVAIGAVASLVIILSYVLFFAEKVAMNDCSPIAGDVVQVEVVEWGLQIGVLRSDGTVRVVGDNTFGQCDVEHWQDVVKIWVHDHVTFGLTKEGKLLSTYGDYSSWTDVENLFVNDRYTDYETFSFFMDPVVAVKTDGTVVARGFPGNESNLENGWYDFSEWRNIKDVFFCDDFVLGLNKEGIVYITGRAAYNGTGLNILNVHPVKRIYDDFYGVYLLEESGKVWYLGHDLELMDVGWSDAEKLEVTYDDVIYCVTKSGTVRCTNYYEVDEEEETVPGLSDIEEIAVFMHRVMGLRTDGTVAIYPEGEDSIFSYDSKGDISQWGDIVKMKSREGYVAALREDGTLLHKCLGGDTIPNDWENVVDFWFLASGSVIIALTKDGNLVSTSVPEDILYALTADVR